MIVARKHLDAGAALSVGLGPALLVLQQEPIQSSISLLGWFTPVWMVLLLVSGLGAAVGCELRTRDISKTKRLVASVTLERCCWPGIAFACSAFTCAVIARYGFAAAVLTIAWTTFVILTCIGHWWVIRRAAKDVRR